MDGLLNKVKNAASGKSTSSGSTTGAGNAQKEDYGDKGLDAVEKKFGVSQGRETNEKITDGARDFYEKQSGSKVNSKFSN